MRIKMSIGDEGRKRREPLFSCTIEKNPEKKLNRGGIEKKFVYFCEMVFSQFAAFSDLFLSAPTAFFRGWQKESGLVTNRGPE